MEYLNGTLPDTNDSDGDAVTFNTIVNAGMVMSHDRDWNLSDGREVFKYGTNPMDNDTDGDMLPDWYEYEKDGMNPMITTLLVLNIEVQWIDAATGGSCAPRNGFL